MQAINFLPLNIVLTLAPLIQTVYLLSCFLVGLFGRKKKMGFWGVFLFFHYIFSHYGSISINHHIMMNESFIAYL